MRERIEITPLWARNFLSETVGIEEPDLPRVYCYGDMYPWGGHMGQTLIRCAMQETNGTSFDLRKLYRSVCRQYIDAYEDVWHVKGFELEDEMMHFEMAVDAGDRNLNEIVRQRLNGQAISGSLPTPFWSGWQELMQVIPLRLVACIMRASHSQQSHTQQPNKNKLFLD